MKFANRYAFVCLALAGFSNCLSAADPSYCRDVKGRIVWTLLGIGPTSLAPFDPAGRVLGSAKGDFRGATTAIIKSAKQNPDQSTTTNDLDIFVTGPGDIIYGDATATFTPIAGRPSIKDVQTIVIRGGTGRWLGAYGTLSITGEGTFLNPPAGQVAGNLIFDVSYTGHVCKIGFESGWWQ